MFSKFNISLSVLITLITTVILYLFGRDFWCPAGDLSLWSFDVNSQHNSQHLLDWYTPSHISHGLLFFLFLRWLLKSNFKKWGVILCVFFESTWEVIENSDFIINRYREATIALNYFGDSILNSVSDIGWCTLGFYVASKLKTWQVLAVFIFFELLVLYFIRDNLSLNVLMLLYPVEAVKSWQMGG